MGISLALYRARIGSQCRHILNHRGMGKNDALSGEYATFLALVFCVIYVYILCITMAMYIDYITDLTYNVLRYTSMYGYNCPFMYNRYNDLTFQYISNACYLAVITIILRVNMGLYYPNISPYGFKSKKHQGILSQIRAYLFHWSIALNLILIIISNPGIINPGPNRHILKLAFQNIQGFIPLNNLGNEHPKLDFSKVFEFQSYISFKKPDLVGLNETWLTDHIVDNELVPNQAYKFFRLDRPSKTHPLDPTNPNKFKKYGGGVLIALMADLDVESKIIPMKCKAEILSIEIKFKDGTKFRISLVIVLELWGLIIIMRSINTYEN